jgi:cytosine/adenosine deaminase-related metal-dependent hydrolase
MVTRDAAEIMRLRLGEGSLSQGGVADLVVVRDRGETPAAALPGLRAEEIEMVMVGGEVKLSSPGMADRLPALVRRVLHPIVTEGRERRQAFLAVDVRRLCREAEMAMGQVVLSGKKMLSPP